jgi:predicted outer membrane protein
MNVRSSIAVLVCSLAVGFTGLSLAQQSDSKGQPNQVGQGAHRGERANADQTLASCIAIANQEEISIAKFAEEKAKNSDVKEFARMLVKDHQAFLQKLQRYAPEAATEGYLNEQERTTSNNDRNTSTNQSRDGDRQSRIKQAGATDNDGKSSQQTANLQNGTESNQLDAIQLHREIAEERIRSAKQELSKKDGDKFDKCFIGHQIAAHAGMKNKLVVFQRHVKGDLSQIIGDGIETTEKHMKKAEEIMKKIDHDSSGSKSERSSDSK